MPAHASFGGDIDHASAHSGDWDELGAHTVVAFENGLDENLEEFELIC